MSSNISSVASLTLPQSPKDIQCNDLQIVDDDEPEIQEGQFEANGEQPQDLAIDVSMDFETDRVFDSRKDALKWCQEVGKHVNSVVIVIKYYKPLQGRKWGLVLGCETGGVIYDQQNKTKAQKKCGTPNIKKYKCPFQIGVVPQDGDKWKLNVINGQHNHEIAKLLTAYSENDSNTQHNQQGIQMEENRLSKKLRHHADQCTIPDCTVNDEIVPLTGSPYFMFIVTKTQITHPFQLCLPAKFLQFLPSYAVTVVLSHKNKSWEVKYHGNYAHRRFTQGWKEFVIDNKLKIGDGCVFELIDDKTLKFKVRILNGQIPAEFADK